MGTCDCTPPCDLEIQAKLNAEMDQKALDSASRLEKKFEKGLPQYLKQFPGEKIDDSFRAFVFVELGKQEACLQEALKGISDLYFRMSVLVKKEDLA